MFCYKKTQIWKMFFRLLCRKRENLAENDGYQSLVIMECIFFDIASSFRIRSIFPRSGYGSSVDRVVALLGHFVAVWKDLQVQITLGMVFANKTYVKTKS